LCNHEIHHVNQILYPISGPKPTINDLECEAYKVEEECLTRAMKGTIMGAVPLIK
jgi:hypothetical protein